MPQAGGQTAEDRRIWSDHRRGGMAAGVAIGWVQEGAFQMKTRYHRGPKTLAETAASRAARRWARVVSSAVISVGRQVVTPLRSMAANAWSSASGVSAASLKSTPA